MAKIVIDAGHGLYTPGKRCLKSIDKNQTREWVLNDRVADALEVYLESAGHTVMRVDNINGKTDVSLSNRVKKANNWDADVYISVHHNAGIKGGKGGGTVVFVCKNCGSKSLELQKEVYKHAIKRANLKGNRSDGTLASDFYVIKYTKMPAILVECGFMDSATDIEYILDPKWSKKIALGIAEGVCEVFGGTVVIEKKTTSTAAKTDADDDKDKTLDSAKSFDKTLAKKYKTTANLKMRYGAGAKNAVVTTIPKGKKVQCYGYYTDNGNTRWLLVKYGKYTGFCSKVYLK